MLFEKTRKEQALAEARKRRKAKQSEEIPMGAVVVMDEEATAKLNAELEQSERQYWEKQGEMGGLGQLDIAGPSGAQYGAQGDANDAFIADNPISTGTGE